MVIMDCSPLSIRPESVMSSRDGPFSFRAQRPNTALKLSATKDDSQDVQLRQLLKTMVADIQSGMKDELAAMESRLEQKIADAVSAAAATAPKSATREPPAADAAEDAAEEAATSALPRVGFDVPAQCSSDAGDNLTSAAGTQPSGNDSFVNAERSKYIKTCENFCECRDLKPPPSLRP